MLSANVDRVIVMADGRIVANGTPTEMIQLGILPENGLDEPLYVKLLRRANVDVASLANVADVKQVIVDENKVAIEQLKIPVKKGLHDTPKLVIENIDFSYDKKQPLFKKFSTVIHQGEVLGIVGKNGSGKTTLSHLLLSLIHI